MNWGAGGWGVSLPSRVAGPQHWVGVRKTSDGEDVGHRPAGDRDSVGWDRGGLALCPFPQPSAEGREQWGSSLRALQAGDWGAGCVTVHMGSTSMGLSKGSCAGSRTKNWSAKVGGGVVGQEAARRRAIRVMGVSQGEDVWGVKATGGLHVCECLRHHWLSDTGSRTDFNTAESREVRARGDGVEHDTLKACL